MNYTIKQLADLAGVSVRTLHYYDEIGLLRPSFVNTNGYRFYQESELVKLQQILFFKELDFELEQIRAILESPDYDAAAILEDQKRLIQNKKERLEKLITTITYTISSMKKNKKMEPKEMYGSFSKEEYEQYKKEAQERWGAKNVQRSENIVKGWSKEKFAAVQAEGEAINNDLAALMERDLSVESPEVQAVIDRHFHHIIQFYPSDWSVMKIYRGLADMYVQDERFARNYNKHREGMANFMSEAMKVYCERKEEK